MRGYPCCECCLTDTRHPDHHVVPCPTCNNPTVDRLRAEVERLTQHKCPSTDRRPLGYYRHPRLDGQTECPECGYPMHEHGWLDCGGDGIVVCPSLHGPFGGQAVTDYARNHTCQPVWRPTTSAEIQPGWEVRSRSETGAPVAWGIAHHRDEDGDWRTGPEDAVLTYDADGWTCETTEPLPTPDPRIAVVLEWADDQGDDINAVDLLTRLDNLKEYKP